MKRRTALLLAASMVLGVLGATPVVADETTGVDGGTYLALGDSVAAGTQQPEPFTDRGYADRLFRKLQRQHGFDDFVNLSCPGDDSTEMISGIGGASEFGSLCYGPFAQLPPGGTSQLDAAVEYLTTHPGEVRLITLTMGANDILACDPNSPDAEACLATQLGVIAANLPVIITALRAAAPGVPIVAMNYYNPNLAFWIVDPALADAALALSPAFTGTLEAVYGALGVPVVDIEKRFRTFVTDGNPPKNVRVICRFTLMCERASGVYILSDYDPNTPGPQTDIHPSNKGYRTIAKKFMRTINDLGLLYS
ncbi:MAG: SGNH/GDSL hydrolase family protein [Acidimicrobiia bacterium]|nr:SGNH/GDSL hydrolase family protein [Acidimicrobiia bacterium]